MHKPYLLLRNNKQQGPFTLEELEQQALKPDDLVWIEGQSAGWRFPSEIDALQPYITVAGGDLHTNTSLAKATRQATKPKTNKSVYVSLPSGPKPAMAVTEAQSDAATLEEKAEALRNKVQAYAAAQKQAGETGEAEIKYSRSLNDIKAEYSSWLHEQKQQKKTVSGKRQLTVLCLSLAGIAAVFFVFQINWPAGKAVMQEPIRLSAAPTTDRYSAENEPVLPAHRSPIETMNPATKAGKPGGPNTSSGKAPSRIAIKKAINSSVKKSPAAIPDEERLSRPASTGQEDNQAVSLPDLVRITGRHKTNQQDGVQAFPITVTNNSNEILRVVAVDVFYQTGKGKPAGKKTLYFSNLGPGKSMTLTAPQNTAAAEVNYRLGLLSSSEGIYYAKN
ncbi:MAG TPA: DUF4339 domain-containing protein [Flavisolibacter sp.]|nr:DUF4339 domain-containing protein [Flavisolibacter sp.]